jgi:hypothetical protein
MNYRVVVSLIKMVRNKQQIGFVSMTYSLLIHHYYVAEKRLSVRIIPKKIINVKVQFLPIKSVKYVGRLKILMEKNPYENFEIDVSGQGFVRPVVFENLDIIDTSLLNDSEKTSSLDGSKKSQITSISDEFF